MDCGRDAGTSRRSMILRNGDMMSSLIDRCQQGVLGMPVQRGENAG